MILFLLSLSNNFLFSSSCMWAETYRATTAHHPQHGHQTPRLYIWGLYQYSLCEIQEKKNRNHPLKSIASGDSNCDSGEYNPQERLKRYHLRQQDLDKDDPTLGKKFSMWVS